MAWQIAKRKTDKRVMMCFFFYSFVARFSFFFTSQTLKHSHSFNLSEDMEKEKLLDQVNQKEKLVRKKEQKKKQTAT